MRVFISWSGERSRAVSDVLRRWFPSVLQAVRPYFSPDDVAKGSRWSTEIAKELEASRVGLLVVTAENQDAPWLLFEAGALAKSVEKSKVCPLLFGGMEPTDVKGPLVQFQASQFSKDEMKRVVKMKNGELGEAALSADVLDSVFEMWWPKLDEQVTSALAIDGADADEARRSERDLLEEVLALTRRLSRDRDMRTEFDHPVWDDLFMSVVDLARATRGRTPHDETTHAIRRLMGPLQYLTRHEMRRGRGRIHPRARHLMMELEDMLASDLKGESAPEAVEDESDT